MRKAKEEKQNVWDNIKAYMRSGYDFDLKEIDMGLKAYIRCPDHTKLNRTDIDRMEALFNGDGVFDWISTENDGTLVVKIKIDDKSRGKNDNEIK